MIQVLYLVILTIINIIISISIGNVLNIIQQRFEQHIELSNKISKMIYIISFLIVTVICAYFYKFILSKTFISTYPLVVQSSKIILAWCLFNSQPKLGSYMKDIFTLT